MRRWTILDQGQFREFPRDEPVWYDCPMLDIPNTMISAIENMPDNIVAVSIVNSPIYPGSVAAGVSACEERGFEVIYVNWDTMERSHQPKGDWS